MDKISMKRVLATLYPSIILSNLGFLAVMILILNVFFNIEINFCIKQRTFKKNKNKQLEIEKEEDEESSTQTSAQELYQAIQEYSKLLDEEKKKKNKKKNK